MPSPFPGMDPYLESYLWPDLHQSLAGQLKRQLAPLLRPGYVARLAIYFVGDNVPAHEVGIVYPDGEVVRPQAEALRTRETASSPSLLSTVAVTPPALIVPAVIPLEVRLTSVHVLDVAGNELVTSIEILSPTNKREPGLTAYRQKRSELIAAGVHVLEIDLIRRGSRAWAPDGLPATAYVAILTRAKQIHSEVWPIELSSPLPILPVPLRAPDPDVPLDLPMALSIIYDESDYSRTLDYRQPPIEPPLSESDAEWLDSLLRLAGLRPQA